MNESSPSVLPRSVVHEVPEPPTRAQVRTPDLIVEPEPLAPVTDLAGDDLLAPRPSSRMPRWATPESTSQIEAAVARVGRKWLHGDEIVGRWLEEARGLARELETALACGRIEEVGNAGRRIAEVLAWMDAATREQRDRARLAAHGFDAHDPAVLMRDAAAYVHSRWPAIDLQLPELGAHQVVCRQGALGRAVDLALEAVIRKLGGVGSVQLEVEDGARHVLLRVRGRRSDARPHEEIPVPDLLAGRLRHFVVTVHGGRLFRDAAAAGE
ncbi:MAG TPA: hypothetical protein PKE00_14525, partial [Planctomycetota bacterium]|nr:hypothetical protein [Planctomycetota bacterium]